MSVKAIATGALHDGREKYMLSIEKLNSIRVDESLSFQEKISMFDTVRADFFTFIEEQKESLSQEVALSIEAAEKRESVERIRRINDVNYQTILVNTLQQIPYLVSVSPKALQEKLSIFSNDLLAIGALKCAMGKSGYSAAMTKALPKSTEGMAAELVSSVKEYTDRFLQELKDSVLENAYNINTDSLSVSVDLVKTIDSYISYLEGLSEDGSSYSEPETYDSATEANPDPAALAKMLTNDSLGTIRANHSAVSE